MFTPRLIFAFLFLSVMPVLAQTDTFEVVTIEKSTLAFAEKDSTLYLDFYRKKGDTAIRPCVIFVFGGGFAVGNRDARAYDLILKIWSTGGLK